MPLYEYYCQTCRDTFDLLRPIIRMDDEALCPECNGSSQRKLSVFAVVLDQQRWGGRALSRAAAVAVAAAVAAAAPAPCRRSRRADRRSPRRRLPASPPQESQPMSERLAIHGGTPIRTKPFPAPYDYGDDDVAAVTAVLRRGNETGSIARGPEQAMFEREFADRHDRQVRHLRQLRHLRLPHDLRRDQPGPRRRGYLHSVDLRRQRSPERSSRAASPCSPTSTTATNIDPADVEAKITPRTRAIVAVHMFGNPCDMDAYVDMCKRHGLYLIEDCSQAHFSEYQGRTVGTMGDVAGYSFSGKHISGGGGGAVPDQQPLALGPGAPVRRPGPQPTCRPIRGAALRSPVSRAELQDERSDGPP